MDLVRFVVIPLMDLLTRILQQILLMTLMHDPHPTHLPNHQDTRGHYQIFSILVEDRQVDMVGQMVEIQAHLHPMTVVVAILRVGDGILCLLMRKTLIKTPVLFHILFIFLWAFFSTARFELRIPMGGSITSLFSTSLVCVFDWFTSVELR